MMKNVPRLRSLMVPLAALLIAAAPAAQAAQTAETASDAFAAVVGPNAFRNTYSFTISALSDLTGFAIPSFIEGFSASLDGTALADTSTTAGFQFAASHLAAGSHDLTFSGTGTTHLFSAYAGGYKTMPSVVPEPATAVMAVLAVAMLGSLVWRRRSQ